MTEKEIGETIAKHASKILREEIEYIHEESQDWECPYTWKESLEHVENSDLWDSPNIRRAILKVQIALGIYVPISKEEYSEWQSTGDKRRCFPKLKGQYYTLAD